MQNTQLVPTSHIAVARRSPNRVAGEHALRGAKEAAKVLESLKVPMVRLQLIEPVNVVNR